MTRLSVLTVLAAGLVGGGACGGTVGVPMPDDDPTGIWQFSDADSEVTLGLATDGTFERVDASIPSMQCGRVSGSWAQAGDELVLSLDATSGGGQERFAFSVDGAVLSLTDAASGTRLYSSVSRVASCVDYGFGSWQGTLAASVDGEALTFNDVEVDLDIDGGSLRITSLWRPCPTCPPEDPELIVEIDAPGELDPGTYTVQNFAGAEMTMFGFFHPDPGDPDFEGFSTERLSPPGEFVLAAVAPESVSATFSFRGNPRSDGNTPSDGSTFTLVMEGVVELTYR
ncbi:MAG: hypothetical protein HKN72_16880 [Gemmatimonadetes bacterium]|nr:hypothetical protein [Gemmatimonadota bacterium]NNL30170.1 hypothetical protein [Gemmatimonadota bacterium]